MDTKHGSQTTKTKCKHSLPCVHMRHDHHEAHFDVNMRVARECICLYNYNLMNYIIHNINKCGMSTGVQQSHNDEVFDKVKIV